MNKPKASKWDELNPFHCPECKIISAFKGLCFDCYIDSKSSVNPKKVDKVLRDDVEFPEGFKPFRHES